MRVLTTVAEVRRALDQARHGGAAVGLVPTMGALHDGHVSLLAAARLQCDLVVATIFVNPLQFGAGEDLEAYPRDLDRDHRIVERSGADLLFVPPQTEMYDDAGPVLTTVSVAELSEGLEGASRPTHFAGVATVVAKLFAIAGPCRAYFGEKDFQQLAVIRRLVTDLSFPVEVVGCPTVRDLDGLALSSRNAYLGAEERAAAPVLYRALRAGAAVVLAGERDRSTVQTLVADIVAAEPLAEIDYAVVVDASTLAPVDPLAGDLRLLVAARFGRARLLDNVGVRAE